MNTKSIIVPADVPSVMHETYIRNYTAITQPSGRLMLFAADQKIEHLNDDFYGEKIHPDALNPEHLFKIAHNGRIGAFATHLGLIARYGERYPQVNYLVKLNGKTNLVSTKNNDPVSLLLWNVDDVVVFQKNSGIPIRGIGYTIYIGSEFEDEMLMQAAQLIAHAHEHGLVTVLWIYARGTSIKDDTDPQIITGAAGLANALGSDFVKIKVPHEADGKTAVQWLKIAQQAAGNTKVICSGGRQVSVKELLQRLDLQLHEGNVGGCAIGRNIFQRSYQDAVALTRAVSAMVLDNVSITDALNIFNNAKS